MSKSKFHIKIENVVAFVVLGVKIPLNKLVGAVENTEYEPEQFPGLVYRITDPRAAALIFSSGKIVCTGAKNIEKANEAIAKVVAKIGEAGIKVPKTYDVEVENIVASSKIDAKLNLEEITFSLENAEYEPEQFPGLVYRITEPRVAFLLFSSGKIICTGARNVNDVYVALDKLKEKLEGIGVKVKPVAE
jgi:transcription initiation factor TFIID TATA-box-binding protein